MGSTSKTRFLVEGMDCASCAIKIESALKGSAGLQEININVSAGIVIVYGSENFNAESAIATINKLGYNARQAKEGDTTVNAAPTSQEHDHDAPLPNQPWWQTSKGKLVIVSGGLLALAVILNQAFPQVGQWPFVAATLVALVPVAKRAFSAARTKVFFTIEMLMTIAAIGAIFIHAAQEAAVVVLLFAIGEVLEGVAAAKARRSISSLDALAPKKALLVQSGGTTEVPADSLMPGQVILARPGDRIACDGRIIEGSSDIDEAPVTGESIAVSKTSGDSVFAGTINLGSAIKIEVTRAAADNTIARIIRYVEEAQSAKAPVQRFIDRMAKIYMPIVVIIALLIAVIPPLVMNEDWGVWTYRALALLLIACPCALVISTPAAIAAGLSSGARRGLLVKGGATLEALAELRMIAFDKTGTLTTGKPQVTDIKGFAVSEEDVLRFSASLENGSNHPIAYAVLADARKKNVTFPAATTIKALAGHGLSGVVDGREFLILNSRIASDYAPMPENVQKAVWNLEGEGKTIALLIEKNQVLGLFAVRDEPRSEAKAGLQALSTLGIAPIMLTGDGRRTAEAIAKNLGIEVRAELMPEDKAKIVRELTQADRGPVGKVGDGINDAPALAEAHVGIAMGGGTDVALETADAALLNNSVMGVVELVGLARATMANIRANVTLAIGSKLVFLITTVLGMTGMWIAVMADTGATILVTLNAMRLLGYRFKD